MDQEPSDFPAALRAWLGRAELDPQSHPSPQELLAYFEDQLPQADEERLQDHLALCPDCARVLVDLDRLARLETPEGVELSKAEVEARWPAMKERLRQQAEETPLAETQPRRSATGGSASLAMRWAYALAASLLVTTVVFSAWVASLYRSNRHLAGPRVNVHVADLLPVDEQPVPRDELAGSGDPLPVGSEAVLLVFNLGNLDPFPSYRVEIAEPGSGDVVWSSDRITRMRPENFTLLLPRSFLPAGPYRIRLFGVDGEHAEPLADYATQLRYE